MNLRHAVVLSVSGGVLAAVLAGAATFRGQSRASAPVERPGEVGPSGEELAAEIARLRERLRPTATPQQTRNLFRFSESSRAPVSAPSSLPQTAATAPDAPAPPPPLTLIGIAEDGDVDRPVRTAILTALGQLYLAGEGASVATRYRVSAISADAVELVDVSDGSRLRLALK